MRYASDWDHEAGDWVDGALAGFGLDTPSPKAPTVGDRAFDTLAGNIHERGEQQQGPDGPWQRNAPATIKQKGRDDPNRDSGAMMSLDQIRGQSAISHAEAEMTYGKDDECKAKAHFAHAGQSHLKIQRPFYGLTESDADEIAAAAMDDLVNHLTVKGL